MGIYLLALILFFISYILSFIFNFSALISFLFCFGSFLFGTFLGWFLYAATGIDVDDVIFFIEDHFFDPVHDFFCSLNEKIYNFFHR